MSTTKCNFEGCPKKAILSCRCKKEFLLFCAEHIGSHIDSPGKHKIEKLYDESNIETKRDFLLYLKYEVQSLKDLNEILVKEVYDKIIKLECSLGNHIENIDKEIARFESKISETTQILGNNKGKIKLSSLMPPSQDDTDFIISIKNSSILRTPYQQITFEIYKNIEWIKALELEEISKANNTFESLKASELCKQENENLKRLVNELLGENSKENLPQQAYSSLAAKLSEYKEILKKNKELELELLEAKINMNELSEKNRKENEELRQSYEEMKAKESEQKKEIASYELTNKQLKIIYDELYKEKRDLELRYNQLIENEPQNQNSIQAVPSFTQPNMWKSKVPSINKQFFNCMMCKGKFSIARGFKWDCGCLYCENCHFSESENRYGYINDSRCRICDKKKGWF